ncbi:peptidoglycan DD-metalloendopeptidase family protein [Tamlana sp. s12]|uniref:peptidoglycan DD-metalloendopeptidase family protein n=1 Tax=Tamlana sp. s12 TaxID=1630406 RepID=UPI000800EA98|nr:peptidoglycan DD-metalloendopeptidase family protein [Tamlana sp. s12]OBQ55493.1 peptidase M23 [Tamlana sp. s12]QQY83840.1 peptidoglycan DD-metalloendopeptidase family protein [Tamlana sp. s12]
MDVNVTEDIIKRLEQPIKLFEASKYVPIDLSVTNSAFSKVNLNSVEEFSAYIDNFLANQGAEIAYGGYLEVRNIYKRSTYFLEDNRKARNIHLGVDFWCPENTPVLAPIIGKVHSFKNNTNFGDYGPTIILEHEVEKHKFYTLYGHLSEESISQIPIGQTFNPGDVLGRLGASEVNGNYPPHLHFQIIKDIQGLEGDYPGVCSKQTLDFYEKNCPNPELLLKL